MQLRRGPFECMTAPSKGIQTKSRDDRGLEIAPAVCASRTPDSSALSMQPVRRRACWRGSGAALGAHVADHPAGAVRVAQTLEMPLQAIDGWRGCVAQGRPGGLHPLPLAVERSNGEFLLFEVIELNAFGTFAVSVMCCTWLR